MSHVPRLAIQPEEISTLLATFQASMPGSALALLDADGTPVARVGDWDKAEPAGEQTSYTLANADHVLGRLVIRRAHGSPQTGSEQLLQHSLELLLRQDHQLAHLAADNARLSRATRHEIAERERLISDLDAFAHTVAHDLKNPIGVIGGYAMLLDEHLERFSPEDQRRYLRLIAQGADRMNKIVGALLLLSGVRKMDKVEMTRLEMGHIIAEVCERQDNLVREFEAEVFVPENWPAASGYAPWVEEVWVNYFSNALKYGGRPPRVEFGADRQPDGMVRCWVRDNGAGLTPDEQKRLFAAFTRLGQAKVEGHGLGLSIVQRIVEKLGGTVGIESEVGHGSLFYFTLPAADV